MKLIEITPSTNMSLVIKRLIRQSVNARSNCPIQLMLGNEPPKLKGNGYYFSNKRGDVIRYPNAYKRAFGKPIYNPSTIRVEVGVDWILNSNFSIKQIRLNKLKAFW